MKFNDVRLQVTKACNSKCVFCFEDAGKQLENEMSAAEAIRFFEKHIPDIDVVSFTGGEPLMRKDFVLTVNDYLQKNGRQTRLFTNGFLLDKKTASLFDVVQISLDSVDKRVHDYLRGVEGAYERAISAIGQASAVTRTEVKVTVTNRNYEGIEVLVKLCISLNVSKISIRPVTAAGRASSGEFDLSEQQFGYLTGQIRDAREKYSIKIKLWPSCNVIEFGCTTRDSSCPDLLITPNGYLKTCCYQQKTIGSIR